MRPLLERLGSFVPAAIALALPTVFIPGAVDTFILPRASIVIAGACVGVGLALLVRGGLGLGDMCLPLVAAAGAAILAFVFSVSWPLSLLGSYTRYESLPIRLAYLGLLAAPVWLLRDHRSRQRVVTAFVIGASIASLEAIAQQLSGVGFRPDGNLGNANLLGALIAMALPLAVAQMLRGGPVAAAWLVGAAVMAGGLIVSTSRSGALGALAGCLALAVFSFRGRTAMVVGLAASAVTVVALVLILFSPLRLLNQDPGPTRLHLWPDALHLVAARPLTGWGEDATGLVLGRFLSGDWSPGVTFDRAHSGPLDTGATQGLLGLAALGWVLFALSRGAWRWRSYPVVARVGPGVVGALAAACVGYTVWVLFNFDWAPATGAFWLLAGAAWSGVRAAETEGSLNTAGADDRTPRPAVLRSLGSVGLALAAVWFAAMPVLADAWYHAGRPDLAVVADPLQAQYHRALGESLVARGETSHGAAEFRSAARLGETDPALYVELGDQEQRLGESAQARSDYRLALAIDPYFGPALNRLSGVGVPRAG